MKLSPSANNCHEVASFFDVFCSKNNNNNKKHLQRITIYSVAECKEIKCIRYLTYLS